MCHRYGLQEGAETEQREREQERVEERERERRGVWHITLQKFNPKIYEHTHLS